MARSRVLVVEDDAIVAAHLERVLEQMGYDVVGLAATGEDAIELAGREAPHVVLMDVRLRGEMDGTRAAEEIRLRWGVPVIYLTAYADEPLIEKAKLTSPYGYLAKPVREKELRASIEMALYKHATDRALEHLSRVLRAVRDVNQLITRVRDRRLLLQGACEVLQRTRGYTLVTIHVEASPDFPRGAVFAAGAPGLAEAIEGAPHGDPPAPWEVAAGTGEPVICGDLEGEGSHGAWAEHAVRWGVRAVAALPLTHGDLRYGALCVWGQGPDLFGDEELGLLEELATDVAFGLKSIEAEERLVASEARYRELVESFDEVIYAVDAQGRITFVSSAITRLLGYRPEELIGSPWARVVHPEDVEAVQGLDLKGRTGPREHRLVAKDGSLRWVRWWATPILREGRVIGVQGVVFDVTERRRLEVQLRRAQRLEALGQLAGGVAHDFNNVLQTIVGYLGLALRSLDPTHRAYADLKEIERAVERASTLTRQLLAFSKRQALDLRPQNLNDTIATLLKMLRRVLGEHIELEFDPHPSLPPVRADAGQVEQVVLNLALNARDAMPRGGRLLIRTEPITLGRAEVQDRPGVREGSFVVMRVTDTGTGMTEEVRARAFEPFFTTKEEGRGTGLGLAMVYGIVQQHGGFVEIDSELGRGTTVSVYLPAAPEPVAPEEARAKAPPPKGGTETILLAEDEASIRALNARILASSGYRVLQAADGEEAIRLFDAHRDEVRLALLDVVMPKLGGIAVMDHIRGVRPRVPVVFCSGYSNHESQARLVQERGLTLLRKPFAAEALLRAVREALDAAERGS